ncbi:MAG TPA: transcription termination/antitermination protein NusG [Sutterella sp.]|nr:transcription termination/antitermination protein NusG [Sutterella sp.]
MSEVTKSTAMRWYVVHVYSGMEKSVQRSLIDRIERAPDEIRAKFGEVLVPIEKVVEVKNDKRVETERRMYAGYVLVQMEVTDDTWHLVRNTPKVTGFLGGNKPASLAPHEIEAILHTQDESAEKPRPKVSFAIDEKVRLREGAFQDFTGRIVDIDYEKNRLRVSVEIFGRETPVDIAFSEVEKI